MVKLKFHELLQEFPAITAPNSAGIVYRGNTIYDPDETFAGSTVAAYTLYSSQYSQYCVLASKCSITYYNTNSFPVIVSLWPTLNPNDANTVTTINAMLSQPYIKWKQLAPGGGNSQSQKTITSYMSAAKLEGRSDIANTDSYISNMGANPAQQWHWIVQVYSAFNTSATSVFYSSHLTYYTKLFNRKPINN